MLLIYFSIVPSQQVFSPVGTFSLVEPVSSNKYKGITSLCWWDLHRQFLWSQCHTLPIDFLYICIFFSYFLLCLLFFYASLVKIHPLVQKLTNGKEASWTPTPMATRSPPKTIIIEPVHEISNNVVCATSKGSDQPAHTRSLIRAFACRLSIL